MLAGNADPFSTELTKLLANWRVLVTSRSLDYIQFSWAFPLVFMPADSFSCPLTRFHVHRLLSCAPIFFLCLLTHSWTRCMQVGIANVTIEGGRWKFSFKDLHLLARFWTCLHFREYHRDTSRPPPSPRPLSALKKRYASPGGNSLYE